MALEYGKPRETPRLSRSDTTRKTDSCSSIEPDLENLAVTTHPTFQAIVQRADARYQAEGGLSTDQVRRRLVARRAARRKR